jgi:hypothetical protein
MIQKQQLMAGVRYGTALLSHGTAKVGGVCDEEVGYFRGFGAAEASIMKEFEMQRHRIGL